MSWVKNVWNRFFTEVQDEENTDANLKQEDIKAERPKKAPFRFPVISDNEKGRFAEKSSAIEQPAPRRRPSSPALNKARGFEQPAPQIGEAYQIPKAREPRGFERPAPRPSRSIEPKTLPKPRPIDQPEAKVKEPLVAKRSESRKFEPQKKNTRPFEPTRVPSPIHGYNEERPEPSMNSIQKKEQRLKEQSNLSSLTSAQEALKLQGFHNQVARNAQQEVGKEKWQRVEVEEAVAPQPLEQDVQKEETLEQAPSQLQQRASILMFDDEEETSHDSKLVEEPAQVEEVDPVEEPVQVEKVEFVEEPAQVEEAELVEEPTQVEKVELDEVPTEDEETNLVEEPNQPDPEIHEVHNGVSDEAVITEEIRAPEKKREKTVPFNVLMLKSDKERLKKPLLQNNPASQAAQSRPLKVEEPPVQDLGQEPVEKPVPKMVVEKQLMSELDSMQKSPIEKKLTEEPTEEPTKEPTKEPTAYEHPRSDYLRAPENDLIDEAWMEEQGERLIEALSHFQVQASILSIVQGPAVTQFEVTVAQGVKVSKIRNLADDLKLALAAKDIRIQAPIPGRSSIGIEIPNRTSRPVRISEVIESRVFQESDSPLEAALGLDLTGKPVTLDLRKMPHGLIAGATGSGKSVCINSLLVSLLYKSSPRDLKMLLIDPKMVELAPYNHIPHLVSPVITDVKAATASLKWAVEEMERRYQLFAHSGVRDLNRYNKLVKEKGNYAQHLPYILIVIDELADLMMMSPSDVEDSICRIAQKARACGIHLVIATQRPSVDVITGLIKSNIPTRIAFSVSSQVDSRTILDSQGAERLLGRGDMLYLGNGMSAPVRIQGTFVTDNEIEDVIAHVRSQGEPEYFFNEEELIKRSGTADVQDDLFEEACRFIMTQGSASTSLLQRKFHIGYNRAARLMDLIEQHGFISEQNGSKARSVLITENDIESVFQ